MEIKEKTYMVLDLKDYSVSYLEDIPEGGWTEEYKTEKMVLRYIPAGSFVMGSPKNEFGRYHEEVQHKVTLTKPYYMGVFQVTQKQYELVTGDDPSEFKGETHPVERVSYGMLRGKEKGAKWSENNLVDNDSFFGILRAKVGLEFDLPTEAQWEYACRAGTTMAWNNGTNITNDKKDVELDKLGQYNYNDGLDEPQKPIGHAEVGSYLSNAWGLYDMHGNVNEWCLDWYGEYPNAEFADPRGEKWNGQLRVVRGGSFSDRARFCRSAYRDRAFPNTALNNLGFRVALVNKTRPLRETNCETSAGKRKVVMENQEKTYMILDLKDYSVSYFEDVPDGGWTDEYITEKLVLRYIPAGTFVMGSPESELAREKNEIQHKVTLTKPFYMGVFQVTQKQYELITGDNPSWTKGEMRPMEVVSYEDIRGKEKGAQWPDNDLVDEDSFFGIFRVKSGLGFDLPTEAQWEYACRAGIKTAWNTGKDITDTEKDPELDKLGRYKYNGSWIGPNEAIGQAEVGSYLPNAWGLYDMHGNVQEWCLDWYDEYSNDEATDPKGAKSGKFRVLRGGCWNSDANYCRSAFRFYNYPYYAGSGYYGFRVVLVL